MSTAPDPHGVTAYVNATIRIGIDPTGSARTAEVEVNGKPMGSALVGPERQTAGEALDAALARAALLSLGGSNG